HDHAAPAFRGSSADPPPPPLRRSGQPDPLPRVLAETGEAPCAAPGASAAASLRNVAVRGGGELPRAPRRKRAPRATRRRRSAADLASRPGARPDDSGAADRRAPHGRHLCLGGGRRPGGPGGLGARLRALASAAGRPTIVLFAGNYYLQVSLRKRRPLHSNRW